MLAHASATRGNDAGTFAIDASSGAITVDGALDYETTTSYALTVTASHGVSTSTVAVAITVDDALDYETTTSYALTVTASHGVSTSTVAVAITVTDVVDTRPAKPTNLTATVNTAGSITLSWDDPGDDSITGYQILRRRSTEGEKTLLVYVENTGSSSTTYSDTSVTDGVRHVYRIKAINAFGLSEISDFVRVEP
ncbi:MAG: cadherin domain-containing protein [Chloroflexi bacterium]|nr:cadherin domain-containing protein [Chloroflexota bacterium]